MSEDKFKDWTVGGLVFEYIPPDKPANSEEKPKESNNANVRR